MSEQVRNSLLGAMGKAHVAFMDVHTRAHHHVLV